MSALHRGPLTVPLSESSISALKLSSVLSRDAMLLLLAVAIVTVAACAAVRSRAVMAAT